MNLLQIWLAIVAYVAATAMCRPETTTNREFTTGSTQPRAKVWIVHHPDATQAFRPRPGVVQEIVDRAITNMTSQATVREAWLNIVSPEDVVGIKVVSEPGPNSGTRRAVVAAVVRGLIDAGLPSSNIVVWDRHETHLRLAGYAELAHQLGVRLAGSAQAGYDETVFYDNPLLGNLVWGDLEFGRKHEGAGRRSFVSKLVTADMTKIISITPLMNHNQAGVWGNLFSLALGSVDNSRRFETDRDRLATAVPEIYALPVLGDRVVLNIVDALVCQYEGEEKSLLHYSVPLNQLRFSRDPVALDVLSIQELHRQRGLAKAPNVKVNAGLFENAALLEASRGFSSERNRNASEPFSARILQVLAFDSIDPCSPVIADDQQLSRVLQSYLPFGTKIGQSER
jgi:hypothetical protein